MPTLMVLLSFLVGAVLLSRAVHLQNTSTTIILGLGVEALLTVALGVYVLGDKLTVTQGVGLLFVLVGIALVRA